MYRRRGILSLLEARHLLSRPELFSHPVHYAINLAACVTGARLGELRALKVNRVLGDRLVIDSVCRRIEGYVEHDTKTGASGFRIVPIPSFVVDVLRSLCQGKGEEEFVFALNGNGPISGNTVTRGLHAALEGMGISMEEQQRRRIDFHSWRHFFGTLMRGRIADADLQRAVGHTTLAMTERYQHRVPEHLERFVSVQNQVFGQITCPLPQEPAGLSDTALSER